MKKRAPVSSIMTKNLVKLNLGDSLSKAESLFKRNKIRHLPVVNAGRIVGILSYTDLLRISFADATDNEGEEIETTVYDMFSIEQVMTSKVVSVSSDTSIKEVAEILVSKEFHAIPVTENEQLVGIVTTTDVIKYLIAQYN